MKDNFKDKMKELRFGRSFVEIKCLSISQNKEELKTKL